MDDIIQIDNNIKLVHYKNFNNYDFALKWYQDKEIVYLVDGDYILYNIELLNKMYNYLISIGELYFIYYNDKVIGDVTFSPNDLPIVIGEKEYWNKKISKKIITYYIEYVKKLNIKYMYVDEIYDFNFRSIKLFESLGFEKYEKKEKGYSYIKKIHL